jgi:hypothetical protein
LFKAPAISLTDSGKMSDGVLSGALRRACKSFWEVIFYSSFLVEGRFSVKPGVIPARQPIRAWSPSAALRRRFSRDYFLP